MLSFVAILRAIEIEISRHSDHCLRYSTKLAPLQQPQPANDRASIVLIQPQEPQECLKPTVGVRLTSSSLIARYFRHVLKSPNLQVCRCTVGSPHQDRGFAGRSRTGPDLTWSCPIPCPGLEYQCGHAKQIT